MKKLSSLSIFFPSLNDAKILPYLITKSSIQAQRLAKKYEIIIINDGSTDDSEHILSYLKKSIPNLRIIHHQQNRGYGGSLITGFTKSKYDYIFYTDGDGQYQLDDLPLLVAQMNKHIDVVNGYKINRSDTPLRKVIGEMYNHILHCIYPIPIRDIDCDFRLIRKEKLKNVTLSSTSGLICLELILRLHENKARFTEVGVVHHPRLFGKSQFFSFPNLLKTYIEHKQFYRKFHSNKSV